MVRHYIRQSIESDNVYQTANQLPGGLKAIDTFNDGSKQVIHSVIHDISILDNLSDWKEFETELEELKANITREIASVATNLKVKWSPISYQMYYVMMLVN